MTYCSNLLKGPAAAYEPIVKDTEELMSLALKCIYGCNRYINVAYCMLFGLLYAQPVLYLHSELHDIGIDICWYFWFSLKEQLTLAS